MDTRRRPKQREKKDSAQLFGLFLLVSVLLHIASLFELSHLSLKNQLKEDAKDTTIHVKVVSIPQKKPPAQEKNPEPTQILEAPQLHTQAPDEAEYLGQTDHQAQHQTRVSTRAPRDKQADPSAKKSAQTTKGARAVANSSPATPTQPQLSMESPPHPPQKIGVGPKKLTSNAVHQEEAVPHLPKQGPHAYEQLLASSQENMEPQVEAGYQDYVDDVLAEGDSIDINTKEYRYIGYFTNMRKAIELAWNYPMEAAKQGVAGQVHLRFVIEENGVVSKISVLDSSGHEILDSAIVEAIKVAAPFAPLPAGFNRKNLEVTGTFHYLLHE